MDGYIARALDLATLLEKNTVFLFGPRQTGKSSYVRQQLGETVDRTYNLLDQGLLRRLLADPTLLRQELVARKFQDRVVCIDEVQKCPALLDEVHLLIEEQGLRFLLTGSSARRLHQKGSNLLGGRGRDRVMRPLTWHELGPKFDLLRAFRTGLIPSHYLAEDPEDALDSYVAGVPWRAVEQGPVYRANRRRWYSRTFWAMRRWKGPLSPSRLQRSNAS